MDNIHTYRPGLHAWAAIDGIDYGAHMKLLMFNERYLLLLKPGHTAYISRGSGSVYSPTELFIHDRAVKWRISAANKSIRDEGGRFDLERVKKHRAAIDAVFGEGATDLLEWDVTIGFCPAPDERWVLSAKWWDEFTAQKKADTKDRAERKEREALARRLRWG